MKISRNSWHYKLQDNFAAIRVEGRHDLCSYMRGVALSFLIIGLFGWVLGGSVVFYLLLWYISHNYVYLVVAIMWGLVASIVWLRILLDFEIPWPHINLPRWLSAWFGKEVKLPRVKIKHPNFENNIFLQWLKAKKHKICPLIEFEES